MFFPKIVLYPSLSSLIVVILLGHSARGEQTRAKIMLVPTLPLPTISLVTTVGVLFYDGDSVVADSFAGACLRACAYNLTRQVKVF